MTMNLYNVQFDNNEAFAATEIGLADYKSVNVEVLEDKRIIKWLTIFANDEKESIFIANKVVKDYFSFI